MADIPYSRAERSWLTVLAVVGFVVLNGAFVYGLLTPGVLRGALTNPIALAFIVEALVMVGVLAYLLARWGVSRRSWIWFVALSLLGGMAFALPVVLLWRRGTPDERSR